LNRLTKKCDRESPCGQCSTYVEALTVSYDGVVAAEDINFHFSCGELTAIIGANGAGKSSVLKAILGQVGYRGSVRYCASIAGGGKPSIGYVPQKVSIRTDSPISVADFMLISSGFLPVWIRVPRKKKAEMIETLSLVSSEGLIDKKIGELSGGELQRVLLASSLNPMPDILLLDEPVSAMDVKGADIFYETICDLRKKFHMSIVVVTHDIGSIAPHADKIILMKKSILIQGTPSEVLDHPLFIAEMGSVYLETLKKETDMHCPEAKHD
jgi:zinc transport system ATP-binding protein